jgi:hypothetical protein
MVRKKVQTDTRVDTPTASPDIDTRPAYEPPPGWVKPKRRPKVPIVHGVSNSDYEEIVRKLLLPSEDFWRNKATHSGRKKFINEKTKPVRAFIKSVLQINVNGPWPTLNDCIPKGSILEAVDKYFWDNTDIPRELPFFYVLHYVLAKLMQQDIVIHKEGQVIRPDIWTVVVANSGSGKTRSQKAMATAMGGQINLVPPGAKSSIQFLTYLRDYRLGLLLIDEFAQFLNTVSKDSGMMDVRDHLLKTYDNENLRHKTTKSDISVENSTIGILGYSTVKTLPKYLTLEMLNDGFAQRFSYCVAEKDDREIIGNYDFSGIQPLIFPLWDKIAKTPFHAIYHVGEEGVTAFDEVAKIIIGAARRDDVDDSFSRRVAFTTYKYGLAYHILTGKTDNIISPEDLAWGSKLAAMHLLHMRKVLDLYEKPQKSSVLKTSQIAKIEATNSTGVSPTFLPSVPNTTKKSKSVQLTYDECVVLAKKKIVDFAAKGKQTDTRLLGGYVKVESAILRRILRELAQDPKFAPLIKLPNAEPATE